MRGKVQDLGLIDCGIVQNVLDIQEVSAGAEMDQNDAESNEGPIR